MDLNISHEIKSDNYSSRKEGADIKFIIMHFTEVPLTEALSLLTKGDVSSHYVLEKRGKLWNLVDEKKKAWHAGNSSFNGYIGINDYSIGIEIDNSGEEEFTEYQYDSLIKLSNYLIKKYNIPQKYVLGHSDIAPSRKVDPGKLFNWQRLAENGVGAYLKNDFVGENKILYKLGNKSSKILDLKNRLSQFGYMITSSTNEFDEEIAYVAAAFQAHFNQESLKNTAYKLLNFKEYFWDESSNFLLNKYLSNKHLWQE